MTELFSRYCLEAECCSSDNQKLKESEQINRNVSFIIMSQIVFFNLNFSPKHIPLFATQYPDLFVTYTESFETNKLE